MNRNRKNASDLTNGLAIEMIAPAPGAMPKLEQLRELDELILGFSELDQVFAERTRSYSTLLRGTLFGLSRRDDVARVLERRPADVLVLGSNPNNAADRNGQIRFRSLEDQIASGAISEVTWDAAGRCATGWHPFEHGHAGWKLLARSIEAAGFDPDATAMANVVPWGGKDTNELRSACGEDLFESAMQFSNDLFYRLVLLLRPSLVLVPFSVTKHAPDTWLARSRTRSKVLTTQIRRKTSMSTMKLHVERADVAGHMMTVVHVPHPSWMLRLTHEARLRVEMTITNACLWGQQ